MHADVVLPEVPLPAAVARVKDSIYGDMSSGLERRIVSSTPTNWVRALASGQHCCTSFSTGIFLLSVFLFRCWANAGERCLAGHPLQHQV